MSNCNKELANIWPSSTAILRRDKKFWRNFHRSPSQPTRRLTLPSREERKRLLRRGRRPLRLVTLPLEDQWLSTCWEPDLPLPPRRLRTSSTCSTLLLLSLLHLELPVRKFFNPKKSREAFFGAPNGVKAHVQCPFTKLYCMTCANFL